MRTQLQQHQDRAAIEYAVRRMQAKRQREAARAARVMCYGSIRSVLDLRTGERTRSVWLRFPARERPALFARVDSASRMT